MSKGSSLYLRQKEAAHEIALHCKTDEREVGAVGVRDGIAATVQLEEADHGFRLDIRGGRGGGLTSRGGGLTVRVTPGSGTGSGVTSPLPGATPRVTVRAP